MKAYVISDGLNIRSMPSMKGRIIDQAAKGDVLEVLGELPDWTKIKHVKRGKEGYVYSKHIVHAFNWTPWVVGVFGAAGLGLIIWLFG
jgi:uncharacterized protein YgiM (DUF1202 family)